MAPQAALVPDDLHNQTLAGNVHPEDWVNPDPAERYNLVVVGARTAGLVAAAGAAGLGARVALVERHLMGGDCLNYDCAFSKGMISAARVAATLRRADSFGVHVPENWNVEFAAAMQPMRRLRAKISHHDSARRFGDLGVDVFLGKARFTGPDSLRVGDRKLRFRKALIATGARVSAPPIAGLDSVDYLTKETIFSLSGIPDRLAILGGGPKWLAWTR